MSKETLKQMVQNYGKDIRKAVVTLDVLGSDIHIGYTLDEAVNELESIFDL